jgi:phosphatidylinositol 4-kinase A
MALGKNLQKATDEQDPVPEISALREKMHSALAAVREKRNSFTIQDLKRLLFRCASSLISVTKVRPVALPHTWLTSSVV